MGTLNGFGEGTQILFEGYRYQAQIGPKDSELIRPRPLCLVIPNTVERAKPEEGAAPRKAQKRAFRPACIWKRASAKVSNDRYHNGALEEKEEFMNQPIIWQNKRKIGIEIRKPMFET